MQFFLSRVNPKTRYTKVADHIENEKVLVRLISMLSIVNQNQLLATL